MEARPHPIVEAIVARLLPPACREHVLGDLHERYVSPGRYVCDAARTVPFAVWGQVRRTTSPLLAAGELGAVYIAYLGTIGIATSRMVGTVLAPSCAALAAVAALITVALRDAWLGRTLPRSRLHRALDAVPGAAIGCASHVLLRTVGSPLALEPGLLPTACGASLVLLAAVRVSLHPFFESAVAAGAGGDEMKTPRSNSPMGLQRDLRTWFRAIAAAGFAVAVCVLAYAASVRIRLLMLGWLAAFVLIGIYQRQKMSWPPRPREGAPTDEIDAYRRALEHRRDQQQRWPARRLPLIAGTVALAFLLGLLRLVASNVAKPIDALWSPVLVATVALAMYAFARTLTNRAAAAFQKEIDELSQTSSGPEPRRRS